MKKKRCIKKKHRAEFLTEEGSWSASPQLAQDFETLLDIVHTVERYGLEHYELAVIPSPETVRIVRITPVVSCVTNSPVQSSP
jgi:hypothetical protein